LRSRGNHSNGAVISRPSAKVTRRAESVTRTFVANGLNFILEVLIPFLQEQFLMRLNQLMYPRSIALTDSDRPSQSNFRLEPVLRIPFRPFHMNMGWFITFVAEEKGPKTRNPQNGGHSLSKSAFSSTITHP
jgi:hypothetical protein